MKNKYKFPRDEKGFRTLRLRDPALSKLETIWERQSSENFSYWFRGWLNNILDNQKEVEEL